ncbi:recombinase family protein [Halobacillus sp. KGW1]|uniref:recombinase family protein n=1 Tax=Halobacillus sp. KGW1 TaxID=1793726 RepID=UPI0007866EAC|nr:recombinase family protein [Halobacillus sp. KGW1]
MPKAVGYVRVSTDKQLENTSIQKQKEEIEKYCLQNQLTLVNIFNEGAHSAGPFTERKKFMEMYRELFDPKQGIDYLITFKSDRISREQTEAGILFKMITDANKHLICIADNIDTRDHNSKLVFHLMSLVSDLERDFIKFRTSTGLEKNAKNGNFNGGAVYGYDVSNKKLQLNPNEARVVKYIFEKYANDKWGYRKIASNLNDQMIRTKNKNLWNVTSVKTILNNKIYIGYVKWKGTYHKGNHTGIIDDELWEKTQKTLCIKSYMPKKIHPGNYPLSGLLKCPECGAPMVQGNSGKKYKYYQCSRNKASGKRACSSNLVNKNHTEEYVFHHLYNSLKSMNLSSPILNTTLNTLSSEVEPIEEKISHIKNDLSQFEEKRSSLIEWRTDDVLSEMTFRNEMSKLKTEEENLKQNLEILNMQVNQRKNADLCKNIAEIFAEPDSFFSVLSEKDKKEVLHYMLDSIQINTGKKPKERTVREINFKFTVDHISEINKSA